MIMKDNNDNWIEFIGRVGLCSLLYYLFSLVETPEKHTLVLGTVLGFCYVATIFWIIYPVLKIKANIEEK